ncbi:MAG: hypothetical protein JWM11_2893 [Planctomycetaceae bacterium]|nr:hypothetical protein [Planctomycetaceae bacterium]
MNTALVYLLAALCGATATDRPPVNNSASSGFQAALDDVTSEGAVAEWISPRLTEHLGENPRAGEGMIVRGQSDQVYDSGPQTQSSGQTQTFVQGTDPNQGVITGPGFPQGQIMQPGNTLPYDPFQGGTDPFQVRGIPPGLEYYDPYSRDFQYGIMGPKPYALGGLTNLEAGFIGNERTHGVDGHLSVTEVNAQWRLSTYLPSGTIFSWKPEFNYRGYDGPSGLSLPGHAYRFASDFEWGGQGPGPWGFQVGFTPQLATDFDRQISSQAYMFDGRGMLFYRADPTLLLVGGVSYWNRVDNFFIPDVGVVWTPDDRWEFRLLYPKSRISVLLGDWGYGGVWLYGSAEYNVEAYQIGVTDFNRKDRMQISDYRFLLGLRSDNGFVSSFVEGGWVTNRHVEFQAKTPDFGIGDGWMLRTGIRY